jgi:DNA invertase Pin-like site-specific DNA recombinase
LLYAAHVTKSGGRPPDDKSSLRALGYCRVSTSDQGEDGLGIAAQRAAIRAECERRGWQVHAVTTDVASAKSTKHRPALQEALDCIESGAADVLVVAKLDRLARSVLDFATLMERAQRRGWAIVALDANVDSTTPHGSLMVNVLAAFAEYERRLISQRTKEALAAKRAQGTRLGRPITLPSDVRDRIRREAHEGNSLRNIAAGLERDNVLTAQGGRWHASTVAAALKSLAHDVAFRAGQSDDRGEVEPGTDGDEPREAGKSPSRSRKQTRLDTT